ncbi:MAG TPA: hypothetical protein VFK57_15355 [Vicinamibacterales bacterium]|nr:hypothetical protein [Vicinamibacterales bacterium]
MPSLSESARIVLGRMDPDRPYQLQDLRLVARDASPERLREIMHELWIARQVERVGDAAWRRHRSAAPHASHPASGEIKTVKPEDLFDYASFAEFFK